MSSRLRVQGLGSKFKLRVEGPKVGPKIRSKTHVLKVGPILESDPISFRVQGPRYKVSNSRSRAQGSNFKV